MADTALKLSSASDNRRHNEEEPASKMPVRLKKKKVRRHRIHKNGSLGRVDEESDEEGERKKVSSRERKQVNMEGVDLDDIPTLNYVSDDKKIVVEDVPDDEEPDVKEEPKEEEEEFDDEEPSMTEEEKKAMFNAAELGDIDLLEDCLDKPNSDINMVWYQENLLIAALKSKQEEMAEFLIDNGVDYNFQTTIIDVKDERTRNIDWYECSCRQLAFEVGLHDIVELIDYLNGDLFPFVKPKARIPRYRRPKPPTPEPSTGGESENDASSEASKDRSEDEGDGRMKKKRRKKKKDSKDEDAEKGKEDKSAKGEKNVKKGENGAKKDKCEIIDEDSGHHSGESFADIEKDEEGKKVDSDDGSKHNRSRASSSKARTGSSRCSTRMTTTTRSPSPPAPKSETFLKRFWFLTCSSDEGYSSLSSKSSPRTAETKPRRPNVPITIPPRGTRSSLGLRQASMHRKAQAEHEDDRPLTRKKIKLPGSYEVESSRWYHKGKDTLRANRDINENGNMLNKMKSEVPRQPDAHYMQMTASAYTKRKLEPNFRKSYSSLDFVSDKISKSPQVSRNQKILQQRQIIQPRTCVTKGKDNISLDFRYVSNGRWRPSSLPNSTNTQLYHTVTRVY